MFRGLKTLVIKELKEILRDKKVIVPILVVPLVLFPLMGVMMKGFMSSITTTQKVTIAVYNEDNGTYSSQMISFLNSSENVTVVLISSDNLTVALRETAERGYSALVYIPPGFSDNLSANISASVRIYGIFDIRRGIQGQSSGAAAAVELYSAYLRYNYLTNAGVDPDFAMNPVYYSLGSYVNGKVVSIPSEAIMGTLMAQNTTIPVTLVVLLILAVTIAGTVMASEKESKTLELLLTLPVDRKAIFLAKLTGTIITALAGTVGYIIGLYYYMSSFSQGATVDLGALGLSFTPVDMVLLGVSLMLALITLTIMALVLSSFAEDVRGAQSLTQVLIMPLVIMSFISSFMFLVPVSPTLEVTLAIIPFSNPSITVFALLAGDYWVVLAGIGAMVLEAGLLLALGARLYSGEAILTARLFSKKKKKKVKE